jgi:hypothetical protein
VKDAAGEAPAVETEAPTAETSTGGGAAEDMMMAMHVMMIEWFCEIGRWILII